MAARSVDIVASGPPSSDLYDPAAPAWALATGLAARGHSVQVIFPGPADTRPPAEGVTVAPFSPVTPHLGTPAGDAELTRAAVHHLRPQAEAIVRDPSGLGAIGLRRGRRPVVSFVRSLSIDQAAGGSDSPAPGGLAGKLAFWGARRGARRLERDSLLEASAICCETVPQRDRLVQDYRVAPERVRVAPPAVARGPAVPTREAARRKLSVPDDVLLAILLPPVDPAAGAAANPALEAFRRTRPIFPGARLGVVGLPGVTGPGVLAVPSRDADAVAVAAAAADVAVSFAPGTSLDPGLVVALRAGVPSVVAASLDLGAGAESAVRRAPTTDSAELASVLAELFADPEVRRTMAESARSFAQRFEPEHLAAELEATGALGAA